MFGKLRKKIKALRDAQTRHKVIERLADVEADDLKYYQEQKLKQSKKRKQKLESIEHAEIEHLTDQLIYNMIGENGELQRQLDRILLYRGLLGKPISTKDAKQILSDLLKTAVANRKLLAGRIEKSVEHGALYEQYYGRIKEINELTSSAYAKMEKMRSAREAYERLKLYYEEIQDKTYIDIDNTERKKKLDKIKDPLPDI